MSPTKNLRGRIFFTAPFTGQYSKIGQIVASASQEAGFATFSTMDDIPPMSYKYEVVYEQIAQAEVVVADVTEKNSNVYVELGFANALGKPIILLSKDVRSIPHALEFASVVIYDSSNTQEGFVARLLEAIEHVLDKDKPESTREKPSAREKVFFSYSHLDSDYLNRILVHLWPLERSGLLDLWADTKIKPGDRWKEEIRQAIAHARIAVLLVSADFLASDFIVTNELPPLLKNAEQQGARIIPIILKPSRFLRDSNLSQFQALNDPKHSVLKMSEVEREELYAQLAETLEVELRN